MKVLAALRDRYFRRWLRRRGVKFATSLAGLPSRTRILVEEGVAISNVQFGCREIRIGAQSYLRSGCELHNVSEIGRFCSIGNGVVLGQDKAGHPLDWVTTHPIAHEVESRRYDARVRATTLGHDVWIGREAMVFEGVSIGIGAVVAARSVVTRDVPPYAIVAGVPARVVRFRFPEPLREQLLDSRWWTAPPAALHSLPLDQPERFCAALAASSGGTATYSIVDIASTGCRSLDEESLF